MPSWCTVLLLLVAQSAVFAQVSRETSYGLFIDLDLDDTTMNIFSWPTIVDDRMAPVITPADMQKSKYSLAPGFPTPAFIANTSLIVEYLVHLIDHAKSVVPMDQHLDTPIFAFGAVGMKTVSASNMTTIVDAINATLSNPLISPFKYGGANGGYITQISGEQYASYGWAAANLLMGGLEGDHGPMHTVAAIDLGLLSTRVGFMPEAPPVSGGYTLEYAANSFDLYSRTYTNGLQNAYSSYLEMIATAGGAFGSTVSNPCGFSGSITTQVIDGTTYNFIGSADFATCLAKMQEVIMATSSQPCPLEPCGLGPVHQPMIPATMNVSLLGQFASLGEKFGCTGATTAFCMKSAATELCAKSYADASLLHPMSVADGSIHTLCGSAALVYDMLVDGFKLHENRTLHIMPKVGDVPVDWQLGAMTKAIGAWDLPCSMAAPAPGPAVTMYAVVYDPMLRMGVYSWEKRSDNDQIPNITTLLSVDTNATTLPTGNASVAALRAALAPLVAQAESVIPPADLTHAEIYYITSPTDGNTIPVADLKAALNDENVMHLPTSGAKQAVAVLANVDSLTNDTLKAVIGATATTATLAFVPEGTPDFNTYRLGGEVYYASNTPSLGLTAVVDAVVAAAGPSHPCLHTGSTVGSLSGTGDVAACLNLVFAAMGVNSNTACPDTPCGPAGVYQPPVPAGDVAITGLIYDTAAKLGCTAAMTPTDCYTNVVVPECSKDWSVSLARNISDPTLCIQATWAFALIESVYKATDLTHTFSLVPNDPLRASLLVEVMQRDVRPPMCYRKYSTVEAVGILDPVDLSMPAWINPPVKHLEVPVNLTTTLTLGGFFLRSGNTISVKLASTFADCLGTAPGSPAGGSLLDAKTGVATVGPVTAPGDYKVCFKHRQDWEPTNMTVSVVAESMESTLYFGGATCDEAMAQAAGQCGCYYAKPTASSGQTRHPNLFRGVSVYNRETSTPAVLVKMSRGPVKVMQGCCQLPAMHTTEYWSATDSAYWGMCRLL